MRFPSKALSPRGIGYRFLFLLANKPGKSKKIVLVDQREKTLAPAYKAPEVEELNYGKISNRTDTIIRGVEGNGSVVN